MYFGKNRKLNVRMLALPILVIIIAAVSISIVLLKRKTITVVADGKPIKFVTYKSNVRQALENKKITVDPKDKTFPTLDAKISNNEKIILKHAVNVSVSVDGKRLKIKSAEDNISKMLKAEGIAVANVDKVFPQMNTKLSNGLNISITRVTSKLNTKLIHLGYKTIVKSNSALPNTRRYIAQEGRDGVEKISTLFTYHNGKEVSRKTIKDIYLKHPHDKIIIQGTYPLMPVGMDGKILPYRIAYTVRATAYWAVRGIGRTYTGSGRRAIRNASGYSTIAVDRRLIPYGTRLFVEGYGFAVAADTGSAIVGKTIDVFFNTRQEACHWAVKHPKVYILK